MKMELPEIKPEERTPLVEALLGIIRQLLDRVQELEQTVQELRDENARLKGQTRRPDIKPSSLEKSTKNQEKKEPSQRGKAKRPPELRIDREVRLHLDDLPPGAKLKGYEPYVVQNLIIQTETTRYLRGRYELPDGSSVLTPLPAGVLPAAGGHFSVDLIRYCLDQYHQAQVTEPLLLEQLWEYGVCISAGQLHHLLTANQDVFHQEKAEVLAAGLQESSYIGVDDTGARHQGHNGYCTAIGNELFSYFESTLSKSRLNFLQVLQGGQRDYVINDTTVAYWKRQQLAQALVERLRQGPQEFRGEQAEQAWQARLAELGITSERHVRTASEGALLGGLVARGISPDLGVLSDGADQFVLFLHAGCWVHADRPLDKLVPHNEDHRAAIEKVRTPVWELYRDLNAYRQKPDEAGKPLLQARFDSLVAERTGYPSIDGVLKHLRVHKADLLRALERPEIPLHNNAIESDIREFVKRRKISGGTRNDAGRRCRDTFASLKKTCRKLGLRFWDYLHDRLRGLGQIPRLADLIRQKARGATASNVVAVPA
jgi:hypothetical protein